MRTETHDVPDWFRDYLDWLAAKPRTIVESWIELEGLGDMCGEDDTDILEICWDRADVLNMPWSTSSK